MLGACVFRKMRKIDPAARIFTTAAGGSPPSTLKWASQRSHLLRRGIDTARSGRHALLMAFHLKLSPHPPRTTPMDAELAKARARASCRWLCCRDNFDRLQPPEEQEDWLMDPHRPSRPTVLQTSKRCCVNSMRPAESNAAMTAPATSHGRSCAPRHAAAYRAPTFDANRASNVKAVLPSAAPAPRRNK